MDFERRRSVSDMDAPLRSVMGEQTSDVSDEHQGATPTTFACLKCPTRFWAKVEANELRVTVWQNFGNPEGLKIGQSKEFVALAGRQLCESSLWSDFAIF